MSFISDLKPAIQDIAKNEQRVAINAGSCDPEAMAKVVQHLVKDHGTDLEVSWVTGDDVTTQFTEMLKNGEKSMPLPSDTPIDQWGVEPICAQAYLGGVEIAEALRHGADIVICGRVADAAPVVGAAMWYHNWDREDFTELAHALMAGYSQPLIPMEFFRNRGWVATMLSLSLGVSVYYSQAIVWPQMTANVYAEGRLMWGGLVSCVVGIGITFGEIIGGMFAKVRLILSQREARCDVLLANIFAVPGSLETSMSHCYHHRHPFPRAGRSVQT